MQPAMTRGCSIENKNPNYKPHVSQRFHTSCWTIPSGNRHRSRNLDFIPSSLGFGGIGQLQQLYRNFYRFEPGHRFQCLDRFRNRWWRKLHWWQRPQRKFLGDLCGRSKRQQLSGHASFQLGHECGRHVQCSTRLYGSYIGRRNRPEFVFRKFVSSWIQIPRRGFELVAQ